MHPVRKQRLVFIVFLVLSVSLALGLVLFALKQNINLFFTPLQVAEKQAPENHLFRLGGVVKIGSIHHGRDLNVSFILQDKDKVHFIPVFYNGILPALFHEGQYIIVEGTLNSTQHTFIATQVLAKHGETYKPRASTSPLATSNNH